MLNASRYGGNSFLRALRVSMVCLTIVAAGVALESQQPSPSTPVGTSVAFSARELSAPPRTNWLKNGGNLFNQNYSPLRQINRETVSSLKGVWRTHLNGSGIGVKYSGEAQPVVHDGTIYIVTGADDVFALSVKSGRMLWNYKAGLPDTITTVCCGWTSRGVAIGDGRVYVGQLDGQLVALDQRSGERVWSIQAERW